MSEIKTAKQRFKTWNMDMCDSLYKPKKEYSEFYRDEVSELRDRISQLERELANVSEQLAEAKKDQARYQWILLGVGAIELLPDPPKWTFRNIPKCSRNVFKGSVAQHFSDAVDLAIKESK